MGVWPPYADGTDIDSLDCSRDKGLVLTASDSGHVRLLAYPCVVRHAPAREYSGHSSHVTGVRFLRSAEQCVSVGGNDGAAMLYDVVPLQPAVDHDFAR